MKNITLHESGKTKGVGKRRRAKLIAADVWGSSGYYPSKVLARDAGEVFIPGVKMYENHFTEAEQLNRPEGDVARLVGKLISYGVFEPDNVEGPGVYADVEFYDSYTERINEIGEDVGLSIRGSGISNIGEADGRTGPIVSQILGIQSVDVVTTAGAGGKLVSILESAGPQAGTPIIKEGDQSMTALTPEEFTAGIAELKESLAASLSTGFEGLSTTLRESLTPAVVTVEEPAGEEAVTPVVEAAQPVVINHAAIISAIAEAGLPAQVATAVVTSVQEGKTIEEAIASQTALKEAFVQSAPATNHLRIVEADRTEPVGSLRDQILATLGNK